MSSDADGTVPDTFKGGETMSLFSDAACSSNCRPISGNVGPEGITTGGARTWLRNKRNHATTTIAATSDTLTMS